MPPMGLLRRDHRDDVDVESCLANLHRLDAMGPMRIVDLTNRPPLDLTVPERRIDPAPA